MNNKEKIEIGFWKEEFDITQEDLVLLKDLKNEKIKEINSSNIGSTLRERITLINWFIVFSIMFISSPILTSLFFGIMDIHSPKLAWVVVILITYFSVKKYLKYIKSDANSVKILEKQKKSAEKKAEKEFYDEVLMKKAFHCGYGLIQIQDSNIEYFQELLRKNKRNKAKKLFYAEKIDKIPIYGTTEGLNIIENIGFASYTGKYEDDAYDKAKFEAYIKGANALLVSNANFAKYTTIRSHFNGLESKIHSNFNLSVNFLKIK